MIPDSNNISLNKSKYELYSTLKQFSEYLAKDALNNPNIGVLGGLAGYSIFQFRCYKMFNDNVYLDRGIKALEIAMDRINNGYQFPTYCNGICGFSWAVQYLYNKEYVSINVDQLLKEFDNYLSNIMLGELKEGNYDVLHGGLGYAFYYLFRYHSTSAKQLKVKYASYLQSILNYLEQTRSANGHGFLWKSFLDGDPNDPVINLSLSHGNASILRFLTLIENISDLKYQAKTLLKDCIPAILHYFKSPINETYSFPSIISPENEPRYNGRLAWCYGDLGLGYALYQAGTVLGEKDIQDLSLEVLLNTSTIRDPEIAGIFDSGLCHGFFGVSHFYQRIFRIVEDDQFAAARDYWFGQGYEHIKSNQRNGVPLQWDSSNNLWIEKGNLLEGVAGIGLCLVDWIEQDDGDWDQALFLN